MNQRSESEWLAVCDTITAGFTPSGDKRKTYLTAPALVEGLRAAGLLRAGIRLLDIGCGNGRLAMGLVAGGWDIEYWGLDVVRPCIEFCRTAFQPWPGYHFAWIDVRNGRYWGRGKTEASKWILDWEDGSFDVVTAFSLFTHLGEQDCARQYVNECRRVLRPGGAILATWYTDPPHKLSNNPARTVYPRVFVADLFRDWEGLFTDKDIRLQGSDQALIVAGKPAVGEVGHGIQLG